MDFTRILGECGFNNLVMKVHSDNAKGASTIELKPCSSLIESIRLSENLCGLSICNLKACLYGEYTSSNYNESLIEIGYIDLDIVKKAGSAAIEFPDSFEYMPHSIESCKDDNTLYRLCCDLYESNSDCKKYGMAIMNRVFVTKEYRGLGIGGYLIDSIYDISLAYGMSDIAVSVLSIGDFSDAAYELGMTNKQYCKYLKEVYEKHGFEEYSSMKLGILPFPFGKVMIKCYD